MRIISSLFLIVAISLVSCSTPVLPVQESETSPVFSAPLILQTYGIGKNPKNGQFQIAIPRALGSLQPQDVQKNIRKTYTFLQFGPTATNDTSFVVQVGLRGQVSLDVFKAFLLPWMVKDAEKVQRAPMHLIHASDIQLFGKPAVYDVYEQTVTDHANALTGVKESFTYFHVVYYVDFGKYSALFWIQTNQSDAQAAILDNHWPPIEEFVQSLKIIPYQRAR